MECVHVLVSRGVRLPALLPQAEDQVRGQAGSYPQPPTWQWDTTFSLLVISHSCIRPSGLSACADAGRALRCHRCCVPSPVGTCRGFGPAPLGLGKELLVYLSKLEESRSDKNLATFQDFCFCSFYFEQGIGLRKCCDAHWKAVCGCWRANCTCKMRQTFGLLAVGTLQVEAGEEHFPITSPVSQPHTENVQTVQAARFPVHFC